MKEKIDSKKRQTLKGMASVAALSSLPAIAAAVDSTAAVELKTNAGKIRQVWPPLANQAPIEVTTDNDGLIVTNKASSPINMSQATTNTGNIDLKNTANTPVHLTAGQSVRIPTSSKTQTGISLLTDANEFSAVSYSIVA